MDSFPQTLEMYGADLGAFRSFDDEGPDLLPYATLLTARSAPDPVVSALAGVYEWQDTPLVFLVDGDKLAEGHYLDRVRRLLAMRGDAPYLGVVRPGQLAVYRVSLDRDPAERARIRLDVPDGEERTTFPFLANERPGVAVSSRKWISNVILKLLDASIEELKAHVGGDDAISLAGRALFTRFLGDRGLLPESHFEGEHPENAFDNADRAAATSRWLDQTFNGDFLPLSDHLFGPLSPAVFKTLGDILRRAPGGQLYLEWAEKWANLDFAHIPVGVLSQAYEHYLRKHSPDKQHKEGGYYTPRVIADIMVRGAFHALDRDGVAHKARILDPAAGAGVFLITAFRQLVAARWRHDRVRPDTKTLREILYGQITGFDINESALRFAALGLYLASIELDPHPEPVQKLRFDNLRDRVLHNVGDHISGLPSRNLGSLGNQVGEAHVGRYDLVIGNPPWASATGLSDWWQVEEIVARIAGTRLPHEDPPKLPNEVLDLPFVWRAMEWVKSGGQITLALHARLLFQQGEGMSEARSSIFRAVNVTGVVNGAELRQTSLWPQISAPFCLLFARNESPPLGASFRFVSPRLEDKLNGAGVWRVDANNADRVEAGQVGRRPEILKVLFRGSRLDLEVYDRLMTRKTETLEAFWIATFGVSRGRPRCTGNGYQRLRESSEIRKKAKGEAGVSASNLSDLRELTPAAMATLLVDPAQLAQFDLTRIHRARSREIFNGPLLLIHKSPPAQAGRIRVAVSDGDVLFNETYYGYSAQEHPRGNNLVRYLAMLIGSKFLLWYALIASGEFGFEREVVEKFVVDGMPIPPFEDLQPSDLEQIDRLFGALVKENNESAWLLVDEWVTSLYGLRQRDLQVVNDTLRYGLPFSENRNAAQVPPSPVDLADFRETLSSELEPWARRVNKEIVVRNVHLPISSPWGAMCIGTKHDSNVRILAHDWPEFLRLADHLAATEVIYPNPADGCLWLARLNQARYWSPSQARLLARCIAWEHLDFLLGLGGK